ncbi:endolytic transglycosylase MltG [Patescibacteria group bacterium]|nr:endolytic transglycosylase MltG [Patescibacteria group bacterium]MBU1015848.1 endolytic transglycosylase MltG [Patescibacteria group bacterium]MBU1685403.1 endolytic transglycosylase MltG [Patescibacteria group bacterium]MBU1938438.1 endolytic transglycosylase MltG [Patescibacteria group bacterium]
MKKIFYLTLAISLVSIFLLYGGYSSAVRYALNPSGSNRITVSVPEGATGSDVADLLYEKGLIKSVSAFNFYLRQNELSDQLRAGRFVFQENFTMPRIVEMLASGKSSEFAVTLLEGWTVRQIAEKLEDDELTTAEDFIACLKDCEFDFNFLPNGYLEGYLYPDTYFVNPDTYSDEAFITRLISTFKSRLSDDDWAAVNASARSFEDIMIMASIVEREERNDEERPTVAGILWNRFGSGTGLYADATVLYGLGRTSGALSAKDLESDSPYNTRKYAGLPPTPISNPGISSIRAALYPKDTDYWYYLHDSDGGVHYAKTLGEHNANKARYIR